MKGLKREVFKNLSEEIGGILCCFCKYAEWEGGCGESYAVCVHPLSGRYGCFKEKDLEPGDDCWGYRPLVKLDKVVAIVAHILVNKITQWSWYEDKGQIYVDDYERVVT